MTKVIEEVWTATVRDCGDLLIEDEHGVVIARVLEARNDHACARLAACAPEMARMLLRTEWIWDNHANAPLCPWCLNDKTRDHAVDCAWLVLMKKAGIR